MKKSIKKVLWIALAFIMVVGAAMPQVTVPVFAADQIPNGAEGIVAYHHSDAADPKYVDYDYNGGNKPNYQEAPDLGVYPQYVYCIQPALNARDYANWNQHFRWRWNLGANKWLLDNSKRQLANPENGRGSEAYEDLAKLLYYGYPHNHGNLNPAPTYHETQAAVEYLIAGELAQRNRINEAAEKGVAPKSYNLYMYLPDSKAKQVVQNTVGLAIWEHATTEPEPEPEPEPGIKNTTAKARQNGGDEISATKDAHAEVIIPAGADLSLTISDVVEFENLNSEKTYTLKSYIWYNNEKQQEKVQEVKGTDTSITVVFDNPVTVEAPQYNISNELYDGDKKIAEHNGDRNIVSERVVAVKEKKGELSTTVKVNESNGSETAEAEVKVQAGEKSIAVDVKDTIDYKNLVKGNTYKVQGTLMEVAEDGTTTEVAKSDAEEKVAEDENGTWEIVFKNVTLEVGKKYVVFESATPIKDAENNEITDGKVIEHNDPEDKAQTIVVTEEEPKEFEVEISKVEVNGTEELPGAELKIESEDVEGFETISWTSGTETKKVTLKPGTYTMTETTAPDGYEVAESITFVVTEDGKVQIAGEDVDIVRMEDAPKEEPKPEEPKPEEPKPEEPKPEEPKPEEPKPEEPKPEEPKPEEPKPEEPKPEEPKPEEPKPEEPKPEEPKPEEPKPEEPKPEEPKPEEPKPEEPKPEEPKPEEPKPEEPKPEEPKPEEPKPEEPKEEVPNTPETPGNDNPPPQVPSTGNPEPPKNETPTTPTNNAPSAPATGDGNNIAIWLAIALTAAFMAVTIMGARRRF